ncbi:hypothetical protein ABB37_00675 [Leptomonas pyrrhocoris]|uniref:Uncharacterized protein n=1 Tax=Leptomonas pyrrhocoris TaxID=157538 RepID=A0A0M9GB31_LEPPY|nr:hypothetical protein ABB37_00675 [Leptomonas pyrrhocoris]KPA86529.1 hypothetical protein ABB37_00675 [Leptomonas pyrrhocoris]|eukprot:XP_015664968.1 hypothetical protein ABB37_00675 [Leptomonas pyrrhocoris]
MTPSFLRMMCRLLSWSVYVLFLAVVSLFSTGAYHWAVKTYRTPSQTINPVMYPSFTELNVSAYAPAMREHYYRLWRTYDWMADGYASPRISGVYTRVPMVYVHGNGGSYYCARSLARFVYESNARLRQNAMRDYRTNVKRRMFHDYKDSGLLDDLTEGTPIPLMVQHRIEAELVRDELPMLGVELFSVDYLEESSTQTATIVLKEARYLNHSVNLIVAGFLKTYAEVLTASPALTFDQERLSDDHPLRHSATDATVGVSAAAGKVLRQVEKEYTMSVCSHASLPADEKQCAQARYLTKRFSTLERVRAEVQRVRDHGVWVWAESLGGVTALLATIMAPQLYAGIVLVGTPTHYPPLFFDHASVGLYEALDGAVLNRYPSELASRPSDGEEDERRDDSAVDWASVVADEKTPHRVLRDLRAVPRPALRRRLRNLTLLAINGGTLDDVVPSISGYLQRSTPRPIGTAVNRSALVQDGACRRDVSTETLRGCGAAMDHRGLVYGLQFLQHAADSLVQAALLPHASVYIGREDTLPSFTRERLFPTVVETLIDDRFAAKQDEILFLHSVRDSLTGKYIKETVVRAMDEQLKELCVDGKTPIDLNDLPVYDEADEASGYYDGSKALNILIGSTTLSPDRVLVPNIQLFHDQVRETPVMPDEAVSKVATQLHLPTTYKGTSLISGKTLQTAFSFAVYRRSKKRRQPTLLWPRFCMLMSREQGLGTAHAHLQYDKIDIAGMVDARDERYFGPHYVGSRVRVRTEPGFALVRGIDSAVLEPHLQVNTPAKSNVFPLVMCGSLHSFYLALRGQHFLAADEPEHQLQYFYGPFVESQTNFTYAWKPFSTYPPLLNETYLVYVLGDSKKASRPDVLLPTYSMLEEASIFSPAYWRWLMELWPQRWLASFSMYTGIARLGGSYIVVFFALFFAMGALDDKLCATPEMRARMWRGSPFRRIRWLRPMTGIVVGGLVLELATGTWASLALRECLSTDPPPYISDAAMIQRMSVMEKITLVVLYGMWPDYRTCRFSWVSMQGVPEWATITAQLGTMYLGFIFAGAFLVVGFTLMAGVGVATYPIRKLVLMPLCRRAPLLLAVVFAAFWVMPTTLLVVFPAFPLCFVDLVGMALVNAVSWMLPRWTRPGYNYRLVCFFFCEACIFPSHFNGLVLTIRNTVMLRHAPAAIFDAERYAPSRPQLIIFGIVQACQALAYVAIFCVLRHEETLRHASRTKEGNGETSGGEKASADADLSVVSAMGTGKANKEGGGYVLGDIGRRYPLLRRLLRLLNLLSIMATLWAAVIALRRPIEGGSSLLGNMTLLVYLSTLVLQEV